MIRKTRLHSARPPIVFALTRLFAKSKDQRPFIIITDQVTGCFVQFASSMEEPLTFEAPQLSLQEKIEKTPIAGADAALRVLQKDFDLPPEAILTIEESDTERPN